MNLQGPGRRERKKRERRAEILKRAADLFGRQGFDDTSMEQIAEAADVSAGTVYNFFPTKTDILVEIQLREIEVQMSLQLAESPRLPKDPARGLLALIEMQFAVLRSLPRSDIKRVTAQAVLEGVQTATGRAYAKADAFFLGEIRERLDAYRQNGALPGNVDLDTVAGLVFAACNGLFFDWIADDSLSADRLIARMRSYLLLILPPSERPGRETNRGARVK